jgi:hypothetical protein
MIFVAANAIDDPTLFGHRPCPELKADMQSRDDELDHCRFRHLQP